MKKRTLLSLNDELSPPPRKLLQEIRKAGIPIQNGLNNCALDARSTEFNRLIELVLSSSLSDKKIAISFNTNPKQGDQLPPPPECDNEAPFRQITDAILDGFEYITDNSPSEHVHSLLASFYVLGPVRDVLPRILETLQRPPKESCSVTHRYPKGAYITNVHFVFGKWFFAARFYRE